MGRLMGRPVGPVGGFVGTCKPRDRCCVCPDSCIEKWGTLQRQQPISASSRALATSLNFETCKDMVGLVGSPWADWRSFLKVIYGRCLC